MVHISVNKYSEVCIRAKYVYIKKSVNIFQAGLWAGRFGVGTSEVDSGDDHSAKNSRA